MNELEKIAEKDRNGEVLNPVEVAIYWVWNDTHTNMGIAYEAAVANAAMQARIEKLETAANKAVEWLHHYPNPDNMEEQAESNRRRALNILEKALTK